ncbi:MAG TPA: HEAT repeat domain-containing protein [Candidatus Polarisedimenticolaceae bacterium]|nr:HEAT repeat domain-containing protein [Candidatus Polarisedimenticolaceae bacterium]
MRRLGSRRPKQVDRARARLSIIGSHSVAALVQALEGDNNRVRSHAMPLLALIQDPRGRGPLVAMLLDRDARMREIASRSLARFPSPDAVAALERLLKREKSKEVRLAAVHGLLELVESGQDGAVRRLLEVLLDVREEVRVRTAACALLPLLKPAARRGLLRRLRADAVEEIARRAAEIAEEDETIAPRERTKIDGIAKDLASGDYAVWNDALHRVAGAGAAASESIIAEMRKRSNDPEYCTRAGMALKTLGSRRVRGLAEALDVVDEPLPLQVLVEVAGAIGEKPLIYRLKSVIERVAPADGGSTRFDPMQRVRAKAHFELARIGSRVAIADLQSILADGERRLPLEALSAVELIGKRDEIPLLLKGYQREDPFLRGKLACVVRTIMKRERIRRNSVALRALPADLRRVLDGILSRKPRKSARRRPGR